MLMSRPTRHLYSRGESPFALNRSHPHHHHHHYLCHFNNNLLSNNPCINPRPHLYNLQCRIYPMFLYNSTSPRSSSSPSKIRIKGGTTGADGEAGIVNSGPRATHRRSLLPVQ